MPPLKRRRVDEESIDEGGKSIETDESANNDVNSTDQGEKSIEADNSVNNHVDSVDAGSSATVNGGEDTTVDENDASNGADDDAATKAQELQARFRALQSRAKASARGNLKATAAETKRLSTDPRLMATLSRKHDAATHKLLKADTIAAGEDFERKRAWDWTVEESEAWDRRMEKKERHREDVAFQDYRQDARKIYKRQLRNLNPDLDSYERDKLASLERAAMSGGLEIVEVDGGEEGAEPELVAIDKDGSFFATAENTEFVGNKPEKAAIDRLVTDIRKAEETRLKKRRDRGRADDDPDVTYINAKNKEFNKRLARSYNKYTAEIRESFERGTNI
ncbi:MAG: pre-mRNA-splicing factor syf2 [Sarcosagium campestre]|nr:MAG: pre-mRNA-splicing factor syf2 [Sarcosagium campestre]